MAIRNAIMSASSDNRLAALEAENQMLRSEIRVSRDAADISVRLVVEQFEKSEAIMARLESASSRLNEKNNELVSANSRLQQLDKLKSDFLSSVSHELRTPLTSIRGFANLIEREFSRSFAPLSDGDATLCKKSDRIGKNLEIIIKESERLTRLINEVLDLSKIEAGRIEWHDAPLNVLHLIADAMNAVSGMFALKPDVVLRSELSTEMPLIIGDADRLLQVMVNLLNNAAKFTERGEVVVRTSFLDSGLIQIDVEDTGVGFPAQDAEAIFDRFQQSSVGDTLTDKPKGTGLGLTISREIVNRHGGRIWATSQPGKGSVFSLTLPAKPINVVDLPQTGVSEQVHLDRETTRADGTLSVLVVDDDPSIRRYLVQLLQEQACKVFTADDGHAALAIAAECCPDLIIIDLAMPVMDGRTAIAHLRANPETQHIPIMVVSAIPGWESAGGDVAMCKPIDEPRFLENVGLLLGSGQLASPPRGLRFLVLHEAGQTPEVAPGAFSEYCEITFCSLSDLTVRIRDGFHGMVVVPTELIDKVDLPMLQKTAALEIMIMPQAGAVTGATMATNSTQGEQP